MTRVIAVQEEQLKTLKENYNKNVSSNSLVQNNGDMLSDSLSANSAAVSVAPIDMETQSVNMNAFAAQPNVAPVISSDVTSEVFGSQTNTEISNVSSNDSVVPEISTIGANDSVPVSAVSNDLPYQEPILNAPAPINVISDEAFVNYINSLRNMLSDFMNDMNSKLDKFQEEFLSKTGANLLNAETANEEKREEIVSVNSVDNQINLETAPVTNIFDADKTFVTTNLIQDITDARNDMENGMSKVA